MKEVRFLKIDAFSSGRSPGNPAGVVHLASLDDLTAEEMQEIARGQRGIVSEVVFCGRKGPGTYALRYYSSECEVEFCGHGSIACMYSLLKEDQRSMYTDEVLVETGRGTLQVINDIKGSDSVYISAPMPERLEHHLSPTEIGNGLGVPVLGPGYSDDISLINAGLRTLIVPFNDLDDVLAAAPDIYVLGGFCRENGIDIVLVYSSQTTYPTHGYRTRVFAPKYGYLEDPATGSGNSALGYHLLGKELWDGRLLEIEQGPERDRPNLVKLRAIVSGGERRVLFGGGAVTRYERTIELG